MDSVYAFGVECIVFIQKKFVGYDDIFTNVNNLADPRYILTHFFPIISIFDSYFASEFILISSIGLWLNSMLKWILVEHRPFWWIKETHYYGPIRAHKPQLRLDAQTCETGPGSPSGHVMHASIVLTLLSSWILLILSKRLSSTRFMKILLFVITGVILTVVTMARLFVSTHFPHQCLLGAIFGFLTVYLISNSWMLHFMKIDDILKMRENTPEILNMYKQIFVKYLCFNLLNVVFLIASPFALYWGQKLYGFDPLWSVKLAFKWCPSPDFVHYDTTPQFSFVTATGSVLGWVLCTSPSLKNYRYDTANRSIVLAALASLVFQQVFIQWQDSISRENALYFYLVQFFANAVRPFFFLRIVPFLATFGQKIKTKKDKRETSAKKRDEREISTKKRDERETSTKKKDDNTKVKTR